jgi:replicative DNA helicase
MDDLRQFADAGTAIIVVAVLARQKDSKGRSSDTDGLSLASFRETSELGYRADDAFILPPDESEGDAPSDVVLKHVKSRHGETKDIALNLDRPRSPARNRGPTTASFRRFSLDAPLGGPVRSAKTLI